MNDTIFDALANEHRRRLLVALLDDAPRSAGRREAETVETGALKHETQVRTAMYHNHLPKLADYGYIEWNADSREIDKGPEFGEIRSLLECIREPGDH